MTPRAPLAIALLLGCSVLSTSAYAGWFDFGSQPATQDGKAAAADSKSAPTQPAPPANLDDSIRQAQALRLAGKYPEAIKYLSQLMLVASDDPRVVSEYGKTLAAMGRASEAMNFLTRAQEQQSGDWTIYSALGVAYDELGNEKDAQINYERALALKPGEPSVLSNFALSRLLAKDMDNARKLAAQAETANATLKDEEITRNIAMIRSIVPEPNAGVAANVPPAAPVARPTAFVPPVQQTPTIANRPAGPAPMASTAPPRPLVPANNNPISNGSGVIVAQPQLAQTQNTNIVPRGVVMQAVPIDPLAGPVAANRAPRPLRPKTAPKTDDAEKNVAKVEPAKAPAGPTPVSAKPISPREALGTKTEAVAKPLTNKPAAIAAAKVQANKPVEIAAKVSVPVKAQDVKPAPGAPTALSPTPVRAADAKTQKPSTKPKDPIPGLRLTANSY